MNGPDLRSSNYDLRGERGPHGTEASEDGVPAARVGGTEDGPSRQRDGTTGGSENDED